MKIILDEKAKAEEILNSGEIYDNIYTTMRVLIKYWYLNDGLRKKKITEKLESFLEKSYEGYNPAKWQDKIEKEVNRYIRKKYQFNKVENINITKSELEHIRGLDNIILERLAFTMLVYCKIENTIKPNNKNWINADMKELFKDAKIVGNNTRKYGYLHKIKEYGGIYVTHAVDGDGIRIDFTDEDSEAEIVISDFREFVLEYLKWRGENIGNCEVCGCRIEITGKNQKYCNECWQTKRSKDINENAKRYYYNNK